MTDDQSWQVPGAQPEDGRDPGAPAPFSYGPPSAAQPYGAPPAWSPPPKPGLIPLRPLSFGTILGAPYQMLRRNPRPTFGVSLLVQSIVALVSVGVVGGVTFAALSRVDFSENQADADTILAGSVATIGLSALIPVALSIIASGVLQGIIVLEASRQTLGDKLKFAQLWTLAKGRVWAVAGYTALLTLAVLLAVAVIVAIAVGLSTLGTGGIAAAVIATILLALGLVVLMAWISTKLAFVPSIVMLERAGLGQAFRRSWSLTTGSFWRLFGTILLVAAMLNIATSIVSFPIQLLASLAPALFAATGDEAVIVTVTVIVNLIALVVGIAIGGLALVIQSATTALLYIDQRMRREGLDLALTEYVEARQSGRTDGRDPFATVQQATTPSSGPPSDSPWA